MLKILAAVLFIFLFISLFLVGPSWINVAPYSAIIWLLGFLVFFGLVWGFKK
jgi:hypothetical protein